MTDFKMVPVEPTPAMITAGMVPSHNDPEASLYNSEALACYRAMIAAAPPAPLVGGVAKEAAKAVIEEISDRRMLDGVDYDLRPEIEAAIETRIHSVLVSPPATSPEREEAKRLVAKFEATPWNCADEQRKVSKEFEEFVYRIAGAS